MRKEKVWLYYDENSAIQMAAPTDSISEVRELPYVRSVELPKEVADRWWAAVTAYEAVKQEMDATFTHSAKAEKKSAKGKDTK